MIRLPILTLALLCGLSVGAQTSAKKIVAPAPVELLQVKEQKFDFGKIAQGKPVTHEFEIVNTGKEVMQIENVQTSCGCTTPEWSNDPIPAGGNKKIKVGYNAAAPGKFERAITIFYNSGQTKQVFIKGEVWQAPVEPAPANESIQLLKNINR